MNSGRRRVRSFHEEPMEATDSSSSPSSSASSSEDEDNFDSYSGPPPPEVLDGTMYNLEKSTLSDPESDPQEARTRSRSRSVHANDTEMMSPSPPVLSVNEVSYSANQFTESRVEKSERFGHLNIREVKALKMGLEQASPFKNKQQLKEEEDEKRAADLERKKRASIAASTAPSSGDLPPLHRYKILLLGDSGVGKSSIICRWTLDTFNPTLTGTVGVDFKAKKIAVDGETIQVQVWDTAGQEQFHKITTSYYRGANGILLVYDVTDNKSSESAGYWMKNITKHANENVPLALVGNKCDLLQEDTSQALENGAEFAKKFNVSHFKTSAKESIGVDDAFIFLIRKIIAGDSSRAKQQPLSHPASSSNSKDRSCDNSKRTANSSAPSVQSLENPSVEKSGSKHHSLKIGSMFSRKSKAEKQAKGLSDSSTGVESEDMVDKKEKCLIS